MYFESFEAFIEMGGHGFYVWLCYAIVSVALVGYYIVSNKSTRKVQQELAKFYARLDEQNQAERSEPNND